MPHTSLIGSPLPPNALNAVIDNLHVQGFNRQSMIEESYSFSDQGGRLVKTNALAFTHELYRTPDYTGITLFNFKPNGLSEETLVQTLAQTAAPFHLVHNSDRETYNFWVTNFELNSEQAFPNIKRFVSEINYSQVDKVVREYAVDLSPNKIIDVKQGRDTFKHFDKAIGYQLSLWAIEVTGKQLVEKFGRAVANLRSQNLANQLVTDISIQTLAAIILAHTGALGSRAREDESQLTDILVEAQRRFPRYFNSKHLEKFESEISETYRILAELRYAGFSPEMLTNLYREAFPDVKDKRALGRYDTPLYLTRRIWENIPIEYLRPEHRLSADMTCGWGSFLIAGHERLSRMSDMKGESLRNHIFGNDLDEFTSRLAGLSLLTATRQDSWQIDHNDALVWNLKQNRPNIIVGNPPFGGNRRILSEEGHTSRVEKANDFLKHAIDILADDGYLAMLMPQSFVASEASPLVRKHLLTNCDVFEIWELPIGIFEAKANSVVIFARKRGKGSSCASRIRNVQQNHIDNFRVNGVFSRSSIISSQTRWNETSTRKLLLSEHRWNEILGGSLRLDNVAIAFQGIIEGKKTKNKRMRDHIDKTKIQWFKGVRNVIKAPFYTIYKNPLEAVYPNDFEEPRYFNRKYFPQEKVLLNALANNSRWEKKVKVTIDRRGIYVSHNFFIVVLRDDSILPYLTLEVIAAVLDWKVCNAWLLEHLKHTQFPLPAIRTLPFPKLTKNECDTIKSAVLEIEIAKQRGETAVAYFENIVDETLRGAYKLDDMTYQILSGIMDEEEEKFKTSCQENVTEWWNVCGAVDTVDAINGEITLWMRGFDALQTMQIPPQMPGWMLREGATFCTKIPRNLLKKGQLENNQLWGRFYPQEYAYMDEAELLYSLNEVVR